jgi:hypothetical protein
LIIINIRFKHQEEFLIKKIEELTQNHFNQTELLENQQKQAKYNEKCRNELNELRKLYNNNNNNNNDHFDCSIDDEDNIDSCNKQTINNNNNSTNIDFFDKLFIKNSKYSTYTPQTITNIQDSSNKNNSHNKTSKSKTWPEKEFKTCNVFQSQNNNNENVMEEHDDLVSLTYINKSIPSSSHRKFSHADSFESAQTNFNSHEDSISSINFQQAKARIFEVILF